MRRGGILWGLSLALTLTACGAPTPAPTEPPAPTPTVAPSGPLVKTDWSKLTPRESGEQEEMAEIGSRWYKTYMDKLVPRRDYGSLVPYAGASYEMWGLQNLNYGLMTMDGKVVVDAVYSDVRRASYTRGEKGNLPMYILRIGIADSTAAEEKNQYAVMAQDGSWCTDFDYEFAIPGAEGVFLVTGDACMVMGADGKIVRRWTWADLGYAEGEKPTWSPTPTENTPEWCGGKVPLDLVDGKDFRILDTATGEQSSMYYEDFWTLRSEELTEERWTVAPQGDVTLLTRDDKSRSLPVSCVGGAATDGYAVLDTADGQCMVYDYTGNQLVAPGRYEEIYVSYDAVSGKPYLRASNRTPVYSNYILSDTGEELISAGDGVWAAPYPELVNGLAEVITETTASYYRPDGTCVLRRNLTSVLGED